MSGRRLERPEEGPRRLRSVRMTDAVWAAVMAEAEQHGVPASQWVEDIVRGALRAYAGENGTDTQRGRAGRIPRCP